MKSLKRIWRTFARTRVGQSIFRVGLPETSLGRMQAMVSSFILHLHPAKVHRHSLQFSYTLGLGLISLYLFLILCITGVALMFFYVPSPERAYDNMKDLEFVVSAGMIARNMHRWSAHLMALRVPAHVSRVLHRLLQAAARIQLDGGRELVRPDARPFLYRLSAPVGSTGVLGNHGRDQHRGLCADHRKKN